ncbi:MAG: alpha/beta hydrolase [Synergistota bacterium]|nr:alpha/beta hydrolase [Synergistota bacterium]
MTPGSLPRLICIAAATWLAVCAVAWLFQGRIIYQPRERLVMTPADVGIPYEDLMLETDDGVVVNAWFLPLEHSEKALLFCHGNAGNMSHRMESLAVFRRLGFNVLLFDYRGYGKSGGSPSEEGFYQDARAALAELRRRGFEPAKTVFFGRSLGGAVAARMTLEETPAALVLESTFTSLPAMGARYFPFLPARLILRDRFDTLSVIGCIRCPVLVVHSPEDEIAPFDHGKRLFEAAEGPKQFLEIHGNHNGGFILSGKAYVDGLRLFFESTSQNSR